MLIKNDFTYMDIFALKLDIRKKLHLTDEELHFNNEDVDLINNSNYVNIKELKDLINKAGFKNMDIPNEIGITKAMWSMAFSDNSSHHRGLRMRTIIAILNAIRNRNIQDPFDKILIKGGTDLEKE